MNQRARNTAMAWQAAEQWMARPNAAAASAAIGGILFVASDSILAANRFASPLRPARIAIMVTCVAAQWCIARSVGVAEPGQIGSNASQIARV